MGEVKTVLSVGTTHPWNAAGIGLDLRVGAELGVRVLNVVCAVSAQDAQGLHALHAIPSAVVRAQFAAIPWDRVGAIRVGAIGSAEGVYAVAQAAGTSAAPLVVDPVFAATLGGELADEPAIRAIRDALATLPTAILTPNIAEASVLLGGRRVSRDNLEACAAELQARGARAVLLKGGHLDETPLDVLATADGVLRFEGERLAGQMRGTGCTLAMALACALARGEELAAAVAFARAFVREKIAHAVQLGGMRVAY
jgi:hydroxymethylpyrimidine/phosphomethylpyrimidine kinase